MFSHKRQTPSCDIPSSFRFSHKEVEKMKDCGDHYVVTIRSRAERDELGGRLTASVPSRGKFRKFVKFSIL